MAYTLTGRKGGTVRFVPFENGVVEKESESYSSSVTSNPVEDGADINDHVNNAAGQLTISGTIVGGDSAINALKGMRESRDIITYTGVTRMAAETLPKYRPCRVTAMDLRHFSVLLPLEADEDPEAVLAPILKTAGQILYNYFSTAIYWAVGRPVNDILKISESQHDAFAALPLLHEGEPVAFYHESPNTQLDHRAQVVGQVQQYIRDHLSERLTLNDVAAVFNFSPNYLSQLFAQNSESGFVEFVTATRITAAKELMASTDLKVYEISDKVGFDSAFYFSKVFKKLEGVSPREYMQRMKVSYVDAKDEATV